MEAAAPDAVRPVERVIIDTDPGIDDSLALFLALSRPDRVKIEGLTIVFGNHYDMDLLASNACRCLEMSRVGDDIKVYKGISKPLKGEYHGESGMKVHGRNGIGNVTMPEISNKHLVSDVSAIDYIIDTCTKNPGEITIITLGPLTNLATAVQKCPELTKLVKRVVTMGGALNCRGNKTPVAEANFNNDATAAKIVMNAQFPLTLVPLNVTHKVHASQEFIDRLKTVGPIGEFCHNMMVPYYKRWLKWGGKPDMLAVHDSSAVMAVIEPAFFTERAVVYVDVEDSSELCNGQCVPDWAGHLRKRPGGGYHLNTTVLMDVDQVGFKEFYLQSLARFAAITATGESTQPPASLLATN